MNKIYKIMVLVLGLGLGWSGLTITGQQKELARQELMIEEVNQKLEESESIHEIECQLLEESTIEYVYGNGQVWARSNKNLGKSYNLDFMAEKIYREGWEALD